jgi:hypothetical protein
MSNEGLLFLAEVHHGLDLGRAGRTLTTPGAARQPPQLNSYDQVKDIKPL